MVAEETLREVLKAQKELYLKPEDRILFVLDEVFNNAPVEEVFRRGTYDIALIPRVERPGQDYRLREELLEGKTVGWLVTNVSISHSLSTKKMIERGMFIISNPDITPDWPTVLDPKNREVCRKNAERILAKIGGDVGGEVHITADDGTDLTLIVPNKNWHVEAGQREMPGTNGIFGELFTAPYRADGVLILKRGDFLTNPINRVERKILIFVEDNRVIAIKGESKQAEQLRKMLADAKDERAYCLGEFAFALNPGKPKRLYRSVIAEKLEGGIHVAIGSNAVCLKPDCPDLLKFPFGRYSVGVHIDCIKFGATVSFMPREATRRWMNIINRGKLVK